MREPRERDLRLGNPNHDAFANAMLLCQDASASCSYNGRCSYGGVCFGSRREADSEHELRRRLDEYEKRLARLEKLLAGGGR
jgi:hypothetical protein